MHPCHVMCKDLAQGYLFFNRRLIMDEFFSEISDDEYHPYEHFDYIDQDGVALDDSLNEFRDEKGQMVIVPEADWHMFSQVKKEY